MIDNDDIEPNDDEDPHTTTHMQCSAFAWPTCPERKRKQEQPVSLVPGQQALPLVYVLQSSKPSA